MYDDDVMLPEGYEEGKDFFGLEEDEAPQGAEENTDQPEAEAPATEPPAPATEQAEADVDKPADTEAPATGPEAEAGRSFKFTTKVDRNDVEVELKESDIPELYQRAQNQVKAQQRLQQLQPKVDRAEQVARSLGYQGLDDMLENAGNRARESTVEDLVGEGMGRKAAEMLADVRYGRAAPTPSPAQAGETDRDAVAAERDFTGEITALKAAFPETADMARLPEEVTRACALEGLPLVAAYARYDAAKKAAEAEQLRLENETLRQNASNAAKAPVKGTAGGGDTRQKPVDDFLRGFGD